MLCVLVGCVLLWMLVVVAVPLLLVYTAAVAEVWRVYVVDFSNTKCTHNTFTTHAFTRSLAFQVVVGKVAERVLNDAPHISMPFVCIRELHMCNHSFERQQKIPITIHR